jgi:DivIVA domain-containing protein
MDALRNTLSMTTEDLPGGSAPGTAHPAGVVPQPPPVRDGDLAELRQPEFPIAMRGYDRAAVDAFVERVNRAIADLQVGRSPQSAIRHALDQVGEETRSILERAHDTADEITGRSQAQAAERVDRAEREARELVVAAEARVRVLDADADEVWHERKRLIDDIQRVSAELAELADGASRRFPAETPESAADTVAIDAEEADAEEEGAVSDTSESAVPPPPESAMPPPPGSAVPPPGSAVPPPPPPAEVPPPRSDGRHEGDAAA